MGLFDLKRDKCAICQEPVPRVLPTLVEGVPICSDCEKLMDQLSCDGADKVTLAQLKELFEKQKE